MEAGLVTPLKCSQPKRDYDAERSHQRKLRPECHNKESPSTSLPLQRAIQLINEKPVAKGSRPGIIMSHLIESWSLEGINIERISDGIYQAEETKRA